jgi:hypothetical protein
MRFVAEAVRAPGKLGYLEHFGLLGVLGIVPDFGFGRI